MNNPPERLVWPQRLLAFSWDTPWAWPLTQQVGALTALVLLLAAVWIPDLARLAGAAFVVDCTWLGVNLMSAALAYRRFRRRIPANA